MYFFDATYQTSSALSFREDFIMQRIDGKNMNLVVPTEILELVETVSKRHNIKEAQALRSLLFLGFDVYKDLEKFGIPQTIGFTQKLQSKLKKERFFSEEKVIEDFINP